MLEKLPEEILAKTLTYTPYQALFNTSLVCKRFYDKVSPTLRGLGKVYHALLGKRMDEIQEACLNSLETWQAVVMSKYLGELTENQLTALACSSYAHAHIILKSRMFQKQWGKFADGDKFHQTASSQKAIHPASDSSYLEPAALTADVLSSSWTKISLESLNSMMGFSLVEEKRQLVLWGMVAQDVHYLPLVLEHTLCWLTGYKLMEMAKISLEHAQIIFSHPLAKACLKPGHIKGIMKHHPDYAKWILVEHLPLIGTSGVEEIIEQGGKYFLVALEVFARTLGTLPLNCIESASLTTVKPLSVSLIRGSFYTCKNPIWEKFTKNNAVMAELILQRLAILSPLKEFKQIVIHQILIKVAEVSVAHAKEIFAIPGVAKRLVENKISHHCLQKLASKSEAYQALIGPLLSTRATSSLPLGYQY